MSKLREEEGVSSRDDDEAAWQGWDEDSSDSNSESDGWIDVEDNDDDLIVSDSEDENNIESENGLGMRLDSGEVSGPSQLATTKVLPQSCEI